MRRKRFSRAVSMLLAATMAVHSPVAVLGSAAEIPVEDLEVLADEEFLLEEDAPEAEETINEVTTPLAGAAEFDSSDIIDGALLEEDELPVEDNAVIDEPATEVMIMANTGLKFPETTMASDETDGLSVSVEVPEGALPAGTQMSVVTVGVQAAQAAIDNTDGVEGNVLAAADITFLYEGEEIQPAREVTVTMTSDQLQNAENTTVIHLDTTAEELEAAAVIDEESISSEQLAMAEPIAEVAAEEDTVTFAAEDFSVYAIIAEGETGDNARLTVNFIQGDTTLASMLVKKPDTTDAENYPMIIYDPGVGTLEEGQIFSGWTLTEDYTAETEVKDIEGIRAEIADYFTSNTVKEGDELNVYAMIYKTFSVTYKDIDGVSLSASSILMPVAETSTEYTINQAYTPRTGEQNFEGWDVEEGTENISNASYDGASASAPYKNGTSITLSGDVVFVADAPAGNWLVFHENHGTYVAPQFVEAGKTTRQPTMEMKRAGYTFGGWYTDGTYSTPFSFGKTIEGAGTVDVYAKWNAAKTADYTVIIWKQNVMGTGYDFAESQTLSGTVGNTVRFSSTANSVVVGETTYSWTGFSFDEYDTGKVIAPEGNTVVNVYFDRITVTFHFYTYDDTYTATTSTNGTQYGIVNGKYVVLTRKNDGSLFNPKYNWYYNNELYTGTRYSKSGSWNERTDLQMSGLYEEPLSYKGYTWPSDYAWKATGSSNGTTSGTLTSFKDAFIPTGSATDSQNFYGTTDSNARVVIWYKQNANGNGYTEANRYYTNSTGWLIEDKFNGFEAYQYAVDDGERKSVGVKKGAYYNNGESVPFNNKLEIYSNRKTYNILYMDGAYVDGNGNPISGAVNRGQLNTVEGITYEASTASYNEGQTDYYDPTSDNAVANYVFGGWYLDDKCTVPYTFTTMPEGIVVYAKWVQTQYRVFLHPNAGTDETLDWGSDDQTMNFRISAGDKVSVPTALRGEYELVGWYTDEACTKLFNADITALNDTTVTTAYDKTVDMTDVMDKWGNGATWNSDIDRYWITKKLDLYAKWRVKMIGAEGISVIYDAGEGTNPPTDDLKYLDQAQVIAQRASTAPEGKSFRCWVVQKWDEDQSTYVDTDVTIYPGGDFAVQIKDAREQDITDGTATEDIYLTYTVQLRAEYEEPKSPQETHITWYANGGTINGNKTFTNTDLQVNEAIDIPAASAVTRAGYKFTGWARMPEPESAFDEETGTVDETAYSESTDVKLWLRLNEDGTWDELAADGVTVTYAGVTQIAADETLDYHALYAVWEAEYFYIYHSSDNTVEKVAMAEAIDGYDITSKVKENFMYGGYYSDYVKKGSYDVTQPAEFTSAVPNSAAYAGGLGYWKKANAYTAKGSEMQPEANKTYFLKEVANGFLTSKIYVIYDAHNDNAVVDNYLIADIDDSNYKEIGLIAKDITTGERIKLATSFTINDAYNSKTDTITAKTTFGMKAGYVAVWKPELLTKDFELAAAYVTPDGVAVEGKFIRSFTVGDGKYKGNFNAGNGGFAVEDTENTNITVPGHLSTRKNGTLIG